MPDARYWRVTFARSQGNVYLQIRELAFLDAAGVDKSIGGTAYASSNDGPSWLPAGAFDKNTSSGGWCNAANQWPASIWYAHPAPVDIAGIRIHFDPNINYAPNDPSNIQVAWSDDGVTWQTDSRVLQITEGGIIANTSCTMMLAEHQAPKAVISSGLLVFASAPAPNAVTAMQMQDTATAARDVQDGGLYRIPNPRWVKEKALPANVPLHRRVQLYNQRDGRLIRETWSDAATGEYSFDYIRGDTVYFIVAFDHTGMYRGVVADNLTPELMT